ncbi:MAG TPA: ECF transporter S component [Roseiflexaceae bacterium]
MTRRIVGIAIVALSSAIGVAAFLTPFVTRVRQTGMDQAGADGSPLLLTILVGLCVLAVLFEAQERAQQAASVALLGILVAINAALRFVEVAIPGPGGFSPIFLLIILTGYVFGGQFGLLMGALTLLVSAVITGGVGPWLPYQMFAAGWVGLTAPICRPIVGLIGGAGRRREIAALAIFGALWGFLYGAIMNLWFWPFVSGPADQYWTPGAGLGETLRRYLAFYLLTSFVWDALGALGNAILIAAFGAPVLRALRRFRRRLSFVRQSSAAEERL